MSFHGGAFRQGCGEGGFRLLVTHHSDRRVVQVVGELDVCTAPSLRECLRVQLLMRPVRLAVDLTEVDFLGAAGLHVLLEAHRTGKAAGCEVVLTGAPPHAVRRALRLLPAWAPRSGPSMLAAWRG